MRAQYVNGDYTYDVSRLLDQTQDAIEKHAKRIRDEVTPERLANLKKLVGCTVRITGVMDDDPAPLEVGDMGVVLSVSDPPLVQIHVKWKSGRTLMLLPHDPFDVVEIAVGVGVKRLTTGHLYVITELDDTRFVASPVDDCEEWSGPRDSLLENVTYEVAR